MDSSSAGPTSGFEACGRAEESSCLRDGRFSQDSRPGLEAAPPLASWRPGHRQALPGSRGGQPRASPAAPSPRTAPPRGQAAHPAPVRRASSCSVCTSRLLPGRQEAAGARADGQRTWSRAPSSQKPVSLLLPLSLGAFGARRDSPNPHPSRRGGSRCSRSCLTQAGVGVSQAAWPQSVLATPMPRGRCDVGARAEPQHRGATWKRPALTSKHVLREKGNHSPSLTEHFPLLSLKSGSSQRALQHTER